MWRGWGWVGVVRWGGGGGVGGVVLQNKDAKAEEVNIEDGGCRG